MAKDYNVGDGFLDKLKAYLKKIGLSQKEIDKISSEKAASIFAKADAADGKEDGQVTGASFLSILKDEYKGENITIEDIEQEYIDAWMELSGDDKILDEKELALGIPEEETPAPTGGGGGGGGGGGTDNNINPTDNNQYNNKPAVEAVTAESLEGKDSSTLRNERNDVAAQMDSVHSEMEKAEADKKTDVATKKEAYDAALKELAEASELKNEDGQTLKDLEAEKTKQEGLITAKEGEIEGIKGDINTSKENITSIQGQLDSLVEPNKAQYTTKTEDGETVFDEAGYNSALAEYNSQKESLEAQLKQEEDNLSSLEQKLATEEKALQDLENGLSTFEKNIENMIIAISKSEEENNELAVKAGQAMYDYQVAKEELASIKEPYLAQIETLNANLSVYDGAITKAEQTEKEEKDKFNSDIEDENALKYKDKIDELYGSEDSEDAEETEEKEEAEETTEEDAAKKADLKELLENALNDKNISTEDKMKLLAYAKGKDENVVIDMLKDDTFFVNAFAEMTDDENTSTEKILAMKDVYFDLQGNKEIAENDSKLQSSYLESEVSLLEKAAKNGNLDKVIKNLEKYGMSVDTLKETIQSSKEYSADQKEKLLSRISESTNETRVNPELTTQTVDLGTLKGVMSLPKDIKEGEELPVLIFFTGMAQNGSNYSTYSMFNEGTTPLGAMFNSNATWEKGSRVLNPEYASDLSSFPGIILELNSPGSYASANVVKEVQSFLDKMDSEGINGVKVKRGKTVVSGASAGTNPAYRAAEGLGSKYVDELVVVSNNPKNIKIDGVDIYGYVADMGEETIYKYMNQYIGTDKVERVKGRQGYNSNHNHVVNLMFTNDSDNNGYSDFFEKHFAKYYNHK